MYFKFWGTRGSVPVPGENTLKYGGNTPCVEIRTSNDKLIILDAGTGIRELGNFIIKNNIDQPLNILLSHYHWDHIQGIPFFVPIYQQGRKITFYGVPGSEKSIEKLLSNQMERDYFPIKIDEVPAKIKYEHLSSNETIRLDGTNIKTLNVYHSSPTLTFKVIEKDKCVVYMTDNELDVEGENKNNLNDKLKNKNKELIEFCSGCDYLIHDMMYDSLLKDKLGWGHSSNKALAHFAMMAEVKNLVFFHYNPDYTDEKIDAILEETRTCLKQNGSNINCIAAREGLKISL
ncbi:MAG TPA: MBL fold metallo-hydrolase [Ignavibacteriaceae bacterium]|jgi:phosphoribosyl 1,2-cyclic phosphodiesterase|nr:MBL fold metallo-hydrolase [Ignavibacteriaceae bacterium]